MVGRAGGVGPDRGGVEGVAAGAAGGGGGELAAGCGPKGLICTSGMVAIT